MNRRDFLKQTPLAFLSGLAVAFSGKCQEIQADKKYALIVPEWMSLEEMERLSNQIKEAGLGGKVVLLMGDVELKGIT